MTDSALQQILDIEAVRRLKARYCYCVAHEDWATFEQLFTRDLVFTMPQGTVCDGRDAFMAAHVETLQRPKVWGVVRCFTSQIDITGPDTATGIWQMEDVHVYPGDGPRVGHHGYGHYHEDYVRQAGEWKFKNIRVTYERMDPLEGGFGAMGPG